jgi:broad specificity phosphatase PhoE
LKILEFENSPLPDPKAVTKIEVVETDKLRERYFGELDGASFNILYFYNVVTRIKKNPVFLTFFLHLATPLVTYNYVWPVDWIDSRNKRRGVESVSEVVDRILSLVIELERKYSKKKIVLSSHADTLQIAQVNLSSEFISFLLKTRFFNKCFYYFIYYFLK